MNYVYAPVEQRMIAMQIFLLTNMTFTSRSEAPGAYIATAVMFWPLSSDFSESSHRVDPMGKFINSRS